MTRQDLTEDRMPNPYTVKSFEECKAGDILEINWDKGNGELIAKFEYYGINSFDNSPLLIDVRNTDVKPLESGPPLLLSRRYRTKPVVFFDANNPQIKINKIERIFWLPSLETDGVYGLEGINWTKDKDGAIIRY